MNNKSGFTSWISPSNIALVKYWGKKENQIPINPSISFTLKNCNSKTKVSYSQSNKGFNYEFFFHGEKKKSFNKKIDTFFKRIIQYCPSLNHLSLKIEYQILNADNILMVAEMDDILSFFEERISEKKNNHYVSQIFIYFSLCIIF